ncbi:MAG: hypothetical protein AB8F34_14220 [Akkermansiaceae bacterium]
MKPRLLISHTIVLVAGWALVSSMNSTSTENREHTKPNQQSSVPIENRLSHRSSENPNQNPYALQLAALASTPLESYTRHELKNEIYNDWAMSSPASLLEYLEHRAWPSSTFRSPFEELARSEPDTLADFGNTHGCALVFKALDAESLNSRSDDPRITLDHYLTNNPAALTNEHFKALFDSGSRIDPDFHLNISRIKDSTAKEAAFLGSAKALLELTQFDTYFKFFHQEYSSLPLRSISTDFTFQIMSQGYDLALIEQLPTEAKPLAKAYAAENISQFNNSETYQRNTIDLFISNGWLDEHVQEVVSGIQNIVYHDSEKEADFAQAEAWKNWAFALPHDEKWTPLKETAIRRWILSAPSQWKNIAQLPNQRLRDIAYTAVMSQVDLEKDTQSTEWMIGEIVDPLYQKAARNTLRTRAEGGDDPFAPNQDPFNPLEDLEPNDKSD